MPGENNNSSYQAYIMQAINRSKMITTLLFLGLLFGVYYVSKNYKKLFGMGGNAQQWKPDYTATTNNGSQNGNSNGNPNNGTPTGNGNSQGNQGSNNTTPSVENATIEYFDTKNLYQYRNIDDLYKELNKNGDGIDARDAAILLHWSSTSNYASDNDTCTQWNNFYNTVKDSKTNSNHKLFLDAVKQAYKDTFSRDLANLCTDVSAEFLKDKLTNVYLGTGKGKKCDFGFLVFMTQYLV